MDFWTYIRGLLSAGLSPQEDVEEPCSVEELSAVVRNAYERGVGVCCSGGHGYPPRSKTHASKVLVSLRRLNRTVSYDADKLRVTVESGATIGEVLGRLSAMGLSLPLCGTLPDVTLADAVAVGLLAGGGSLAGVLEACQVMSPRGELHEWRWTGGVESAGEPALLEDLSRCVGDLDAALFLGVPPRALEALVCGGGRLGVVTQCTLRCSRGYAVRERSSTTTLDDWLLSSSLREDDKYCDVFWFPTLDACVRCEWSVVPEGEAVPEKQPTLSAWAERGLWLAFNLVNRLAPRLSWPLSRLLSHSLVRRLAKSLASLQLKLLVAALARRQGYCFQVPHDEESFDERTTLCSKGDLFEELLNVPQPQRLVPVAAHRRGVRWWLPRAAAAPALREMNSWLAVHCPAACTPLWLAWLTAEPVAEPRGGKVQTAPCPCPYLCPRGAAGHRELGVTVWCDYPRHAPQMADSAFNWLQEELHSIVRRHGGAACWCTAEHTLAAIKQFTRQRWEAARRAADPLGVMESAYC